MAKQYKYGFVIEGDAEKGTKTLRRFKEEVTDLERQTGNTRRRTREWREETDKTNKTLISTKNAIMGVTGVLATMGATRFAQSVITDYRELEVGLLGVSKTTGIAGAELDAYGTRIDRLSRRIPVTTSELLELSQAAGQMGVTGAANLEKFTVTVAKLGRASDLAGEEAATALARILNVTGENITEIDTLASVIVSLGNNVAATESEIARITTEVARATSQFDISSASAAAMAAAMASIGIQAEVGGSSVGRVLQEMTMKVQQGGAELEKFANTVGISAEELTRLFNEDRTQALVYFLEGVSEQGLDAGAALDELGLGGQQVLKTIIPLANNLDILRQTIGLANDEVENATALEEEFAATLNSLDAQWVISQNIMASYRQELAMELLPAVTDTLAAFNEWGETDGPEKMLDLTKKGTLLLTTAIASRLVPAIGTKITAMVAAQAEMVRYQATLARMAGVSRTAAVATGTLRGAMALMGGPAGAAIIAAGTLYTFREQLGYTKYDAEEAAGAIAQVTAELEELTDAQRFVRGQAALDQYLDAAKEMQRRQAELQIKQEAIDENKRFQIDPEKQQELIEIQAQYDDAKENLDEAAAALSRLAGVMDEAGEAAGDLNGETEGLGDTAGETGGAIDDLANKIDAQILSLRQQVVASQLSGKQQAIYNALMQAGTDATAEQVQQIVDNVSALYDREAALKADADAAREAEKSAEDLERANAQLQRQLQEDWAETRREFGEFWADMVQDGENAFDALLNSFERMLLEMTGQLALSGLASMFGIKTPGGAAGGIQGVLDSSGFAGDALGMLLKSDTFKQFTDSTGLSDIFGSFGGGGSSVPGANAGADAWSDFYASGGQSSGFNADAFVSGLKTAGLTIGAGAVGAYAGNALGEGIFSKEAESNIAASVGTAIGSFVGGPLGALVGSTLGSMVDVATGGDGKVRYNAGMLVGPTPSAVGSDRAFEVDPFESGLQVMGAARRVDRSVATDVINTFREVDSVVSKLVRELNGNLDLTKASLGGLDEEATPGSSGTFLGLGGNGALAGDLEAQVDYYVSQVIDHVSGLSDELYANVKAAGTAEEAITILSEALIRQEAESDKAAQAAQEASTAMEKVRQAEERLLTERLGIIGTLTDELESAIALQGSVQMSIYEAMGASPLHEIGVTVSGQIAQIEEQRRLIISAHEEEMRAEQRLHEQRLRSAQSLADAATDIRLGDMSNLNSPLKLDFAQENFRNLATAAANGDMDAISRIQQAADQYISAADDMFASGAGRQEVVSEVLGVLDSLSVSLGQSTYDPAAANQSLINQLSALDSQLADISAGINDDIIAQLENINVTLDELTPNLRDTLTGAIAQWVSSSNPGGNAIIDSLGGIKGSVDALPPEIAGYMSSAMGSWINSMLSNGAYSQVVADSISRGGLDESAANQYLGSQGMGSVGDYRSAYNPDVGSQDIVSQIGAITAQSATEEEAIRAAYEAAIANGVGSKQIADAMGVSQTSILDAVTGLGLPAFAKGGNHSGGWRWVGEQGPELEYTGPSRIFSHQDSMRMMQPAANDGAMVREIQSLNSEVIRLRETVAMIGDDAASQRDRQTRIESEMADELKRGNGRGVGGNIG